MGLGPNPTIYAGSRLVTIHDLSSESKGHVWHYCKDYIKKRDLFKGGERSRLKSTSNYVFFLLTCLISWINDNFLVVFVKLTRDLFPFSNFSNDRYGSGDLCKHWSKGVLDLITNWTLINDTCQFLKVKTMNYCFGWALIIWIKASICIPS